MKPKPNPTKPSKHRLMPAERMQRDVATKLMHTVTSAILVTASAHDIAELGTDHLTLGDEIEAIAKGVNRGDLSRLEQMAVSQAIACEKLFARLVDLAFRHEPDSAEFDRLMSLALRAQSQSGHSLDTLAALKHAKKCGT